MATHTIQPYLALARRMTFALLLTTAIAYKAQAQAHGNWESGQQAYSKTCAYCHEHNVGPVLLGRKLPAIYITQIARRGYIEMPSFPPGFIDDKTLKEIGEFIEKSAAPVTPPAAKK